MEKSLSTLFCLCFTVVSVSSLGTANTKFTREVTITRARCEARCLSESYERQNEETRKEGPQLTVETCSQHAQCAQCIKPCRYPYQGASQCRALCQGENNQTCVDSCLFLKFIMVNKQGTCPPEDQATGFEAFCSRVCHDDLGCKDGVKSKCCSNGPGCGFTCQKPVFPETIPALMNPPDLQEQTKDGSVLVVWKRVSSSVPIVYVVTSHYAVGKHPRSDSSTKWQIVTQTSKTSAVVRDVRPGRWYVFSVAAVSVNGSHGFSASSKAFQLSKAPQPPGPPRHLSQGDSKIIRKYINLLIHWQPPLLSDQHLQITRYKIFWSKRLQSVTPDLRPLHVHSKAVKGNQLSFRLKNLEPDTKYFIQVQAISQYNHVRLKSKKASMYVTTASTVQSTRKGTPKSPIPREIAALPPPPLLYDVVVGKSFYQKNQLQAQVKFVLSEGLRKHIDKFLVHWTPEVCMGDRDVDMKTKSATTHDWQFAIYDLFYDCMYVVKVQPVSPEGRPGETQHTTFYTPSCQGDPGQGQEQSSCPPEAPHPLSAPVEMKHSFLMSSTNVTVVVKWNKPNQNTQVGGYKLLWGTAVKQHSRNPQPVMDRDTAAMIQLSEDATSYTLLDLLPGTTYVVQIQGLSSVGPGRPAFIMFTTPSQDMLDSLRPVKTEPEAVQLDRGSYMSLQTEANKENSFTDLSKTPRESVALVKSSAISQVSCQFSKSVGALIIVILTNIVFSV